MKTVDNNDHVHDIHGLKREWYACISAKPDCLGVVVFTLHYGICQAGSEAVVSPFVLYESFKT
jgi:hypothetical protein